MPNLKTPNISRGSRVAVVAHDAGGAEILSSYVQQESLDCLFAIDGPAKRVFQNRLGPLQIVGLKTAIKQCDWLLTGTGWQTDFEWQAIRQGKAEKKHTVTFLDHWVNYKDRFIREEVECLPNELWAGDLRAFSLAQATFPGVSVRLIENPYFKYFISEVERLDSVRGRSRDSKANVLFVSENINHNFFHQNDAIRFFISNLHSLGSDIARILIRPHPSEKVEKYSWVKDEFMSIGNDIKIELSNGDSLANEISNSDMVVGCSSMAMALGVMVKRRVVSCIPNNEIPLTLPFKEIQLLADLIKHGNRAA